MGGKISADHLALLGALSLAKLGDSRVSEPPDSIDSHYHIKEKGR